MLIPVKVSQFFLDLVYNKSIFKYGFYKSYVTITLLYHIMMAMKTYGILGLEKNVKYHSLFSAINLVFPKNPTK